jgi:hypothetical protein
VVRRWNKTRNRVLGGEYELIIASKDPQRLGRILKPGLAQVASGKEAFRKLREAAGVYGELLDLLRSHKWFTIRLATDDVFKAAYKQKLKNNKIKIGDVTLTLELGSGKAGALYAKRYTYNLEEALMYVEKLKQIGIKANIVHTNPAYVYISTTSLLELARKDENVRKTIADYLMDRAKNGTPKQREIATKLLNRHPFLAAKGSYPIPGIKNTTQAREVVEATRLTLTEGEVREIDETSAPFVAGSLWPRAMRIMPGFLQKLAFTLARV